MFEFAWSQSRRLNIFLSSNFVDFRVLFPDSVVSLAFCLALRNHRPIPVRRSMGRVSWWSVTVTVWWTGYGATLSAPGRVHLYRRS